MRRVGRNMWMYMVRGVKTRTELENQVTPLHDIAVMFSWQIPHVASQPRFKLEKSCTQPIVYYISLLHFFSTVSWFGTRTLWKTSQLVSHDGYVCARTQTTFHQLFDWTAAMEVGWISASSFQKRKKWIFVCLETWVLGPTGKMLWRSMCLLVMWFSDKDPIW